MKTNIHFYYISLSYSWNEEWFMESCKKIKIYGLGSITFLRKSCRLLDKNENNLELGKQQAKRLCK
jgi:hypothetical protein